MSLRVAFMGTPAFALPTLRAVAEAGHAIAVVYTRPPSPTGRGLKERPSPVGAEAASRGWPVETPVTLRGDAEVERLAGYRPDVAVVVAYGALLPPALLAVPRFGCLNLHASLLPRWRGAAPIQRAVMAGDAETGIAVMRMEAGLDTGPVALVEPVPIGPADDAGTLHDILAARGGALMAQALDALNAGQLRFTPQPTDGATHAAKITNAEARIDWAADATGVLNRIRGLSPAPGAFFEAPLGRGGAMERIRVLRAAPAEGGGPAGTLIDGTGRIGCGVGAIRLLTVQRAGRAPTDADAFLRGARLESGARLG